MGNGNGGNGSEGRWWHLHEATLAETGYGLGRADCRFCRQRVYFDGRVMVLKEVSERCSCYRGRVCHGLQREILAGRARVDQ